MRAKTRLLSGVALRGECRFSEEKIAGRCFRLKSDPFYLYDNPIVCSSRSGDLRVVARCLNYIAAVRLNLKHIPVIDIHNLTEEEEDLMVSIDTES